MQSIGIRQMEKGIQSYGRTVYHDIEKKKVVKKYGVRDHRDDPQSRGRGGRHPQKSGGAM